MLRFQLILEFVVWEALLGTVSKVLWSSETPQTPTLQGAPLVLRYVCTPHLPSLKQADWYDFRCANESLTALASGRGKLSGHLVNYWVCVLTTNNKITKTR